MIAKKPAKKAIKHETNEFSTGSLLTALKALKKGDFSVRLPND